MGLKWRTLILLMVLGAGLASPAAAQQGASGTARPTAGGAPATVIAQAFPFKWWQDAKYKSELGLMPDQCKRAEDVYQGVLPRMTSGKDELDRLEKKLSEAIAAGVLPEADVVVLIDRVETARAELGKVRTLMIYRLRQILTPDQRTKMKALHDAWEKERREGTVRKRPEHEPRQGGIL